MVYDRARGRQIRGADMIFRGEILPRADASSEVFKRLGRALSRLSRHGVLCPDPEALADLLAGELPRPRFLQVLDEINCLRHKNGEPPIGREERDAVWQRLENTEDLRARTVSFSLSVKESVPFSLSQVEEDWQATVHFLRLAVYEDSIDDIVLRGVIWAGNI